MKSVIHEEFASGTFLQARAQALSTKSLTESLYVPFASAFSSFLTLKQKSNTDLWHLQNTIFHCKINLFLHVFKFSQSEIFKVKCENKLKIEKVGELNQKPKTPNRTVHQQNDNSALNTQLYNFVLQAFQTQSHKIISSKMQPKVST